MTVPDQEPPSLRADSLSYIELLGQSVGAVGPAASLAVIIPVVFAKAGNATWAMLVPMMIGFVLLVFIFDIFSSRSASAGGLGAFGQLAFGRWGRVAFSWTYLVAILAGIAISGAMAVYYADILVADFVPTALPGRADVFTMAAVVLAAAAIAFRGIKFSTEVMLAMECQSLGCMGLLLFLALLRGGHVLDPAQFRLAHEADLSGGKIQLAFAVAFSCLAGFESVTALGAEARQATKAIPRVMVGCIVPLGLLYIVTAYFLVLLFHNSPVGLGQTDAPFKVLARTLHLPWLGTLVSAGIFLSCFASVSACLNAGSRVVYDLARNGEFWQPFGAVRANSATPTPAIALIALLGLATPVGILAAGTSLLDCISYTAQIAGIASISSYILVTVAAPFYLLRIGALGAAKLLICLSSLAILGTAAFFNLFPVPPWPWRILPYAFVISLAAGIACTVAYRTTCRRLSLAAGGQA